MNKVNEVWRCVYNNVDQLYFAKVINDEVMISDGFNIVRRYNISHINGCAYNGDILWLSTEGSNCLLGVDSADNVTYVKVPVEGTVRIFKAASGKKNYLVLDISCEQKHRYVLFDYSQKTIVTTLPITMDWQSGRDTLEELYVETDNNIGHIICEHTDVVSSRYSDEMSDEDILFYADLSWKKHDSLASITRKIHLYIDYETSDDISGSQTLLSDSNLRFPLFDYYLQHWLIQKSFSVSGRHVVYYCPDICGLIVGEPIGGHVCQIIELPCEIAEETNQFFFNDLRNQLYVIDQDNMIRIYSINCSDLEAVRTLNQVYDDAYVNGINLQRKRDAGDLSFWKILKRAIAAFSCEPVQQKNQNNCSDDRNSFKVTIETPVSGMLISERTHKRIVSFEDWKYKQEIFLKHTIDEETTFIFLSSIGQFSKMIRINEDVKNKGILSIEQELSIEDIECSCDRDAARKKLQTQPTNIYATTQLGYVGTDEDYNFILAILEDCYCKSVVNHGKNNVNVKACVNTVLRLANKYRRVDAIPVFKDLLIMADSIDLADSIREACCKLSELSGRFAYDKPFRIDFHVQTPIDISIFDAINNLRIVHVAQDKETMPDTTYYFRSSFGQFVLEVKIAGVTLPMEVSVDNGRRQGLRVFEQEDGILIIEYMTEKFSLLYSFCRDDGNVSLTRYMGGAREYIDFTVIPKKIRIPEFVSKIGKGAFQGQNATEVIVPAKLEAIEEEAFRYSELRYIKIPDSVSNIGVGAFENCRYLEEMTLPCSLDEVSDSMLEQTAISYIEIPGNVERIGENAFADCTLLKEVTIRQGVEVIAASAFSGCIRLTSVTIPNSVKSIESRAFDKCSEVVITGSKGSYAEKYALKNGISFSPDTNGEDFGLSREDDLVCNKFLKPGKIIIVSGPSVAGKSSVIKCLVSSYKNYETAIFATSRSIRPGEIPNVDYYFLTKEEFIQGIKKDLFFEYSLYVGNYYGTLKEPIYSSIRHGKNVILEMDMAGALKLKKEFPEMILVYILPPNVETVIKRLYNREQDEGLVRERLSVYSTEVYSMLRGDILLVNEKSENTAAKLVDFVDNSNGEDNNYDDNAELIFLLKNGIKKYLNGSSDDRLKTLPKTMANDSNFSLNVSAELREIRAILETIVEEKTDEKRIENLSSDELNEHNKVNVETECRADPFEDGSIKIENLKKQEYSKITFEKFINMFINYSVFKMNMSKIQDVITVIDGKGIIQGISHVTLKRYMQKDTYGKVDVQHYKPLFDLYEQTIKKEKERVEILVRAFSLSDQCKHLQYDDIKNIIIDILHEKCKSVSVRKSFNSVTTETIRDLSSDRDTER